jgi:hypothetical protein
MVHRDSMQMANNAAQALPCKSMNKLLQKWTRKVNRLELMNTDLIAALFLRLVHGTVGLCQ